MLKKLSLILCVIIIMTTVFACSDKTSKTDKFIDGYELYDSPELGFKIQYPMDWMYLDGGISTEEFNSMVADVFGQNAADLFDELGADPSSVTVMWYDFQKASDVFVPNANVVINDSGGIKQNDFKSPTNLKDFQKEFDDYYPTLFDGFKSGGITGKSLGNNYFAIYKFDCTINNTQSLSCYQAMTEKNGLIYIFTYTTQGGKLDDATYEKMLSTLVFY